MTKFIGHRRRADSIDYEYLKLSEEDEYAGTLLFQHGKYRHACYFYVQAMEKYVRHVLFTKINAENEWFNSKTRTHNLDDLLDFLIEIVSTNETIRNQIRQQLDQFVLKGVRFGQLHNELRYPNFYKKTHSYSLLEVTKADAVECKQKLENLKIFLKDMQKIK